MQNERSFVTEAKYDMSASYRLHNLFTKYEIKLTTDKLTYRIQLEERSAGKHNRSILQHLRNASLKISSATKFVNRSYFLKLGLLDFWEVNIKGPLRVHEEHA